MDRRELLQASAAAFTACFWSHGHSQTMASSETHGTALACVLFSLAPSEKFSHAAYQKQANLILQRMQADAGLRERLLRGLVALDAVHNKPFASLTQEEQRLALRQQAGTPFWAFISNPAMGVYNNPEVWPLIGYEGPAFEKGGYLMRGLNDINWLPK